MKVILYRDGKAAVLATLPGEHTEMELSDLLGGVLRYTAINRRLAMLSLKDGKEIGEPNHYNLKLLGKEVIPMLGDLAVICVAVDGSVQDVMAGDVGLMDYYIKPVVTDGEEVTHRGKK